IVLVERELLLDIGLLDRRALFDVEENKLKSVLHNALEKAKENVWHLKEELIGIKEEGVLSKKVLEHLVTQLSAWAEEKIQTTDDDIVFYLSRLMRFCHFLFESKVLLVERYGALSATCAKLISELSVYIQFQEQYLQD